MRLNKKLFLNLYYYDQLIFSEKEKLTEIQVQLAKYLPEDGNYKARLVDEERKRYQEKFREIQSVANDIRSYFRRKLAEVLANPSSVSMLSSSVFKGSPESVKMMDIPEYFNNLSNNDER